MEPDAVPVLLITGTAGSGKTVVAKEIGEVLRLAALEPGHVRQFLLSASRDLDAKMADLAIEDFTIENGADRSVGDLASAILSECGWPGPEG